VDCLKRLYPLLSVAFSLGAVFALEYWSSSEISLFPLYLIPIGLAFFAFGPIAAYAACGVASLAWLIAELHTSSFSQAWIPYQGMVSRGFIYFLITWLLSHYAEAVKLSRARLTNLKRLLPICPDCGMLFCHDGQWRTIEQVINNPERLGSPPLHHCGHGPQNSSCCSEC